MNKYKLQNQSTDVLKFQEILIQDLRIYISEKIEPLLQHVENNRENLHKKYKDLTGSFIPQNLEND